MKDHEALERQGEKGKKNKHFEVEYGLLHSLKIKEHIKTNIYINKPVLLRIRIKNQFVEDIQLNEKVKKQPIVPLPRQV